jgi:PadR family transcriptional regulator
LVNSTLVNAIVTTSVGDRSETGRYPLRFDKSAGIVVVSKRKGKPMSSDRMELHQGTLDLLILKAVALEPRHGWAISARLHQISNPSLQIRHGSLYPALHRLERRGWIKARWSTSENNRRAKYYELTRRGRAELETQTTAWHKLAATVGQVLKTV